MKNKKGSIVLIFLSLTFIIFIIFFSIIYILYIQINIQTYKVKQDIFYIVQNAYISLNQDNLQYYNYKINSDILNQKIASIIKLNYAKENVVIKELKYNEKNNKVHIELILKVKPLAFLEVIKEANIILKEDVKLKNMEVK